MQTLLLVGHGKMGAALVAGWQKKNLLPSSFTLHIIEPNDSSYYASLDALPADITPDIILFAVKPQQMDVLLPAYAKRFGATPLYISIAAGKSVATFTKYLGDNTRIIRAMPNTPALIGKGVTVFYASPHVMPEEVSLAESLFGAVGRVYEIQNEEWMHAVTALSGSGPAYVFHFIESLAAAGVILGLPEEFATDLAISTVYGSAKLAKKSDEPLATLRQNVTSPGGTTEAALRVLMAEEGLQNLLTQAMKKAVNRSKELEN